MSSLHIHWVLQWEAITCQTIARKLVIGFVGIGMGSSSKPVMDNETSLKSVDVPVLDLYGENDLGDVVAGAEARKQAIESNKATYSKQEMVPGAGHFFDGKEEILIDEVTAWINGL